MKKEEQMPTSPMKISGRDTIRGKGEAAAMDNDRRKREQHTSSFSKTSTKTVVKTSSSDESETDTEHVTNEADQYPGNGRQQKQPAKTTARKQPVRQDDKQSGFLVTFLIVLAVLFICVAYVVQYFKPPQDETCSLNNDFVNFEERFSFPEKRPTKTIKAALRTTFCNKAPIRPGTLAIVMLDDNESARIMSLELSKTISKLSACDKSYVYIDASKRVKETSDVGRAIESEVRSGIEKDKAHLVIVDHFEAVPRTDVLLFHGLCDDTNAPYKNVVYILITYVKHRNVTTDFQVTHAWPDMTDDKRSSLESRISGFKIFCYKNQSCTSEICCY